MTDKPRDHDDDGVGVAVDDESDEPDESGWDNPLTPHGDKLLWVLESYSLEPVPDGKQNYRCFGCDTQLAEEQIKLSFAEEGPWLFCRDCVGEAAAAFKFVHEADW